MGDVAKSANGQAHGNTIVLQKVKVCFQVYPGVAGTDAQRGIPGVPYTVALVDNSGLAIDAPGGITAKDGGIELAMATGEHALLVVFDTEYKISVRRSISGVGMVSGVKQRLGTLGYYLADVDALGVDDKIALALLNFQADSSLDADGKFTTDDLGNTMVNGVTQRQLKKDFGG